VLENAWHGTDLTRCVDAVGDEHRQNEVPGFERGLCHESPERRSAPEPARAMSGKHEK